MNGIGSVEIYIYVYIDVDSDRTHNRNKIRFGKFKLVYLSRKLGITTFVQTYHFKQLSPKLKSIRTHLHSRSNFLNRSTLPFQFGFFAEAFAFTFGLFLHFLPPKTSTSLQIMNIIYCYKSQTLFFYHSHMHYS